MYFTLQVEQLSEKEELARKQEELDKTQNQLKVNSFLCEWWWSNCVTLVQDENLQLKESQVADLQKLLKQRDPETKVGIMNMLTYHSLGVNIYCSNVCFGYTTLFLRPSLVT